MTVIKALLTGCEKVKSLSVLSRGTEKDFCDLWTRLLLYLTFFRL